MNQKLDNIRTQIGKQYQKISDHDNFVSAEKVKNAYLGFGDEYRTLFSIADEFYESYAKRVGKDRTEGSYEQLLINRRRVELFLKDRYGLSDIPIKEIEPQFIEDYYAYLLEERKLAGSTLLTSVTKLKQIMLIAQRKGYVQVNPFAGFRFKAKTRDRGYLTEDELKRFMAVELRRYKQRQIRDIFVFQAFTGLAYADVKKLTFDDIQKSFDGEQWLIAKRKKTNTTFYVKLLPVAKQLIEQYRLVAKSQFVFPVPSNSGNMNLCLRRIAKICGITKRIDEQPYIYHFTHLFNAVDIIKSRTILSRNKAEGHFANAAGNLVARRNTAHHYARFYYRPQTPTQFYNECLGMDSDSGHWKEWRHWDGEWIFNRKWKTYYPQAKNLGLPKCPMPVFFKFDLKGVIRKMPLKCYYSTGNMQTNWARVEKISDNPNAINTNYLYSTINDGIDIYKEYSQQEFLVEEEFDFSNLDSFEIICYDEEHAKTLKLQVGSIFNFR